MLAIWGLVVATLGFLWYWNNSRKNNFKLKNGLKDLPGPKGLPLIGNMLDMGGLEYKQFAKWADEYGSIYRVKAGTFNTVVISDPKLCKELFNDPLTTGRFLAPTFELWEDSPGMGIAAAEGERWAVHRRFLLRHLRDFGFGKSSTEASIMEEVNEVIQTFKKKAGTPVGEIRETMRLAFVNTLWQMMSSERFDQNDPVLMNLASNTMKKMDDVLKKGGILLFLPWMRYIIPEMSGYRALRNVMDENKEFLTSFIRDYKKTLKEDEEPKDFIGVYLAEVKKQESDPTSHFHGDFAERQLASICFDMFFAGSDTSATTTAWTFLYLCKFPHIQKRFQQEITEVTRDSRNVSLTDRPNMPYTLALIDEVLRFSSIAPNGEPHRTLEDMKFHGYFLPKDVLLQPNIYYIHFDKKLWGDPENFRPERFLSENGKQYVKSENVQAFMVGRRQCPGETLARDNLFLFLANFFQQFHIQFDPNEEEPSLEGEAGILLFPLPYKVIITERLVE